MASELLYIPPVNPADFIATSEKGANDGVATLGSDGLVPLIQLPPIGGGSIDDLTGATLHTIADADNFVFDGDNGTIQTITLGDSRTFTIVDLKVGIPYTFIVKQDATGSRVLTWSTTTLVAYAGAGAPPISTTANAIDIYEIVSSGVNIFCKSYSLNLT